MANGPDNSSAEVMMQRGEALAQSIRERGALMSDIGERTARIVIDAVASYARHTAMYMENCQAMIDQNLTATAQLEPLAGRLAPIDTDKMERELREPAPPPQAPRMPGRMPGAPQR